MSIESRLVILQEYLPHNEHDYRRNVAEGRTFGFRRFNLDNDFRASGSGKWEFDRTKIDLKAVNIAHDISAKVGFQSMAYDFLRGTDGELRLLQISYTFVGWVVQKCPGYWDNELNWHEGHVWAQEAIAEDFLNEVQQIRGQ